MKLSISEICSFTKSTPSCRNFIEGERILNAEHLIFCGRKTGNDDGVHFIAFCLQTSHLKSNPHEITGTISTAGKILDVKCSCKAGLSKKCKHSVAVFLHLNRMDVNDLDLISCTDIKCLWKIPHKKSVEMYLPSPFSEHECFKQKFKEEYPVIISEQQRKEINELLINGNQDSALYKHICGRHEPLIPKQNNNILEINNNDIIKDILEVQPSHSMLNVAVCPPNEPEKECCKKFLKSLQVDTKVICEETLHNKISWKKERQFRVTGSRCYALYTYIKNKAANWQQKSEQYFFPKEFKKTNAIKHGIEYEASARSTYEEYTGVKIERIGLVVPEINPWLGYSPDGITLDENRKPHKLIEIKCPLYGKTKSISEAVQFLPYLNKDLTLKQKHNYFGQIQFGMAILNVQVTDFIVYASFDNSFVVITVQFDPEFTNNMLISLKNIYYNVMLHHICIKKGLTE